MDEQIRRRMANQASMADRMESCRKERDRLREQCIRAEGDLERAAATIARLTAQSEEQRSNHLLSLKQLHERDAEVERLTAEKEAAVRERDELREAIIKINTTAQPRYEDNDGRCWIRPYEDVKPTRKVYIVDADALDDIPLSALAARPSGEVGGG